MRKKTTFTKNLLLTIVLIFSFINTLSAQIYQHNFGTTTINSYPYNAAPTLMNPDLSNSVWTNNTGAWVSYLGSAGQALGLANSSGAASVTLTFSVAAGKQLSIDSFSFWRQRSPSGAQNWSMAINGINVGAGTIPQTAAATGTLAVANPITNLTGTINVVISLSGSAGVGTFRVDDFTLNGTVTSACVSPVITSISPSTGPVNTLVTINGSGFQNGTGTSSVKLNGVNASFTVVSDNVINAFVPAGSSTGVISVTTNSCPGNGPSFTVTNPNCTVPLPTTDLYISELYDQESGSGGMIEIYNPTAATINLSGYTLQRYGNISDTTPAAGYILNLTGTLGSELVYLVACSTPNPAICVAPSSSATLGSGFNGNDKFELLKNGTVIDRVNVPFTAPGYTLIRKPDAVAPTTTYNVNDWNTTQHPADQPGVNLPNNFCQDLGNHIVAPIPGGTPPTVTPPVSVSICENSTTTFSVTISDPTGFTYQWKVLNAGTWVNIANGSNYSGVTSATLTLTGIPLGFNGNQYYCEMTSGSGTCTLVSNAAQLSVVQQPVVPTVTITQPTCTVATGSITITSPIAADISYSLDGTTFQAGTTFNNLVPGTYNVTVKNAAGCTSTTVVTINPVPAAPAVATVTTVQPTCTTPTGSITITTPIAADITYSLDGTTFQAGTTFSNLVPGTYTITVKNAAGCTSVTPTITINPVPAAPAVATVATVQPTCTTPTGSITITNPIDAGITYSLDGTTFQAGTTFGTLTPGTYNVTVKNAAGCTSVTTAITINAVPAAPAVATVTTVQPTCTTPTGSITVTNPIAADITYSLDGTTFQAGTTFSTLIPGTYIISVKNGAGCTSVAAPITINPVPGAPAVATVTTVQLTCIITTGSITITNPIATDITYSLDGTTFQTGTTFSNLTPGTYNVTVKNGAGCTSVTTPITIDAIPAPPVVATITTVQPTCAIPIGSITVTNPIAADLTYSLDGTNFQAVTTFSNLTPGTYNVTVKNAAGCTSVTTPITINTVPGAPATATATTTQPTCTIPTGSIAITNPVAADLTYSLDGTTFQAGTTFSNLTPGTYTVTVKNAAGCTSVTSAIIIDPVTGLPAAATVTATQPTCAIPTASITITNPIAADLTYSLNGTTFQAGTTFSNLAAGTYTVTVKNAAGCTSVTPSIIINTIPNAPQITINQGCQNTVLGNDYILEALPLDNSFDISTATFVWKNSQGTTIGNNENTFDVTQYLANNSGQSDMPVQFTVTVINPDGCDKTITINVDSYFCTIPKGISPNNDGLNDNFNLTGLNVNKLSIFNRYGHEVYTKNNYTNEWHGQSSDKGDELPTGTYYYVIEATNNQQTGWVYINRQD